MSPWTRSRPASAFSTGCAYWVVHSTVGVTKVPSLASTVDLSCPVVPPGSQLLRICHPPSLSHAGVERSPSSGKAEAPEGKVALPPPSQAADAEEVRASGAGSQAAGQRMMPKRGHSAALAQTGHVMTYVLANPTKMQTHRQNRAPGKTRSVCNLGNTLVHLPLQNIPSLMALCSSSVCTVTLQAGGQAG